MARKSTKTTKPLQVEEESQTRSSLFDYLRFGESYTSLILGIIVVIISTILLLSFVQNKNAAKQDAPQLLSQKDIALPSTPIATEIPSPETANPTNTPVPTKAPLATPTTVKKAEPSKAVVNATPTPAKMAQGAVNPSTGQYTVAAGDNLWTIAEKQYKSGYNWVDIARVNKLPNPNVLSAGQKLTLPKVEQKVATIDNKMETKAPTTVATQPATNKITGNSYKTVKGDNLWNISVRAYGDGYQWKKIASANKLSNPGLIHSGNAIKIPRN